MSEEIEVVEQEQSNITEEDAKKALREGNNPSLAVEYYSSKLQSLVQQYGEVAPECADTYLAYGKALLSQARVEFDILGTGINKTIEDQNKEPEPEPQPPINTNGKNIFFNDDHTIEEKESDDEDEEGQDPTNPQDTVENAWNVLEVARVIYTKLDNKLALAEVYLTLGDLSMESDNMEQAVTEYSECLMLRRQVLAEDDRKLAEVHYSIALANNFLNKNKEALTHFVMAKKIFESRLTKLQLTPDQEPDEIKDVKEIIADLQDKIEEFTGPMPSLPAMKAEAKEVKSETGFSKPTMSNSTPVNTLTARVKTVPPANPSPPSTASSNTTESKTVVKRKIEDV